MTIETIRALFAWSSLINIVLLLFWFLVIMFARDWIYNLHSRWFKMPREEFDAIHYKGILYYKIGILLFNLIPYFALRIVSCSCS